jgi:hypothetical protein
LKKLLTILFFCYSFVHSSAQKTSLASEKDTSEVSFTSYRIKSDDDIPRNAKRQLKKGDHYYSLGTGKYEKALAHYKMAFTLAPDNAYIDYKIGLCYLMMSNKKYKSIMYLDKAYNQNKKVSNDIHYYLGKAHHFNQDYEKAIEEFKNSKKEYQKAHKNNHVSKAEFDDHMMLIERNILESTNALEMSKKPEKVTVENIGDSINSKYADYDPFINKEGNLMIFTSRREDTRGKGKAEVDNNYFEDIYMSKKIDGVWSKAKKMEGNFNKKTNDAVIGISPDAKKIFIYRDAHKGDIYMANFNSKKGSWDNPKPIKEINSEHHESSAALSLDENTLYFVSDRPGGFGGRDIYYVEKSSNGEHWSSPKNIGGVVNTPFDEERVFMHPNGKTLYFASKGHNSIGGYDIFSTEKLHDGSWSKPENLGYPINSVDDDISFTTTIDGEIGYLSSFRSPSKGDRDIFVIYFGVSNKKGNLSKEDDLIYVVPTKKQEKEIAENEKLKLDSIDEEDGEMIVLEEKMNHLEEEIAELNAQIENSTNKKEIKKLKGQVESKIIELEEYKNEYLTLAENKKENYINPSDSLSLLSAQDSTYLKLLEDTTLLSENDLKENISQKINSDSRLNDDIQATDIQLNKNDTTESQTDLANNQNNGSQSSNLNDGTNGSQSDLASNQNNNANQNNGSQSSNYSWAKYWFTIQQLE